MNLNPELGVAVFTDGSCFHGDRTGGWGWVALDAFEGLHSTSGFVPDTTISRMELAAPTNALFCLAEEFGPLDVLIYSDSEYVVLGAMDRSRKRLKNKRWWGRLDKAIQTHNHVEFTHVRGHSDHLYNEMADQLAGEARRKGST